MVRESWSTRLALQNEMRVLVADNLPEKYLAKIRDRGHDLRYEPHLGTDELPGQLGDAEILVVRSTKVTATTLEEASSLGLIIRAGAGINTIDIATASRRAIYVANIPGRNSVAVAELTLGLMLALDRRIPDNVAGLRDERWQKEEFSTARGLKGRRLGVIGMGAIGTEVASRARAFGMRVAALQRQSDDHDSEEVPSDIGVEFHADLSSLLPKCDVVTLHLPAGPDTAGMVNTEFLEMMKDGAHLINTSRADLIVADDLIEAIATKDLWVALDVFPDEPEAGRSEYRSELAKHPRVYGTHHIGASTHQAQEAVAKQVIKVVDAYEEGAVKNVVNLAPPSQHTTVIGIRHIHRVGVLSRVLTILRMADISVAHMENHIFEGGQSAKAVMHLSGDFSDSVRDEIDDLESVFDVALLRVNDSP